MPSLLKAFSLSLSVAACPAWADSLLIKGGVTQVDGNVGGSNAADDCQTFIADAVNLCDPNATGNPTSMGELPKMEQNRVYYANPIEQTFRDWNALSASAEGCLAALQSSLLSAGATQSQTTLQPGTQLAAASQGTSDAFNGASSQGSAVQAGAATDAVNVAIPKSAATATGYANCASIANPAAQTAQQVFSNLTACLGKVSSTSTTLNNGGNSPATPADKQNLANLAQAFAVDRNSANILATKLTALGKTCLSDSTQSATLNKTLVATNTNFQNHWNAVADAPSNDGVIQRAAANANGGATNAGASTPSAIGPNGLQPDAAFSSAGISAAAAAPWSAQSSVPVIGTATSTSPSDSVANYPSQAASSAGRALPLTGTAMNTNAGANAATVASSVGGSNAIGVPNVTTSSATTVTPTTSAAQARRLAAANEVAKVTGLSPEQILTAGDAVRPAVAILAPMAANSLIHLSNDIQDFITQTDTGIKNATTLPVPRSFTMGVSGMGSAGIGVFGGAASLSVGWATDLYGDLGVMTTPSAGIGPFMGGAGESVDAGLNLGFSDAGDITGLSGPSTDDTITAGAGATLAATMSQSWSTDGGKTRGPKTVSFTGGVGEGLSKTTHVSHTALVPVLVTAWSPLWNTLLTPYQRQHSVGGLFYMFPSPHK